MRRNLALILQKIASLCNAFAVPPPLLALAPMQAVTNLPFMRVMQKYGGPDYYVTEYFRVHAHYSPEKKILRSITENTTGRPIYAQLIGNEIDALVRVSQELQQYPIAGIDLNLGCPAPVVYRKEAGGGLLKNLSRLEGIIAAMREAIPGKFTVKTRLGFHSREEFTQLLAIFKRYQIDILSIHGRTVAERYFSPVNTDCIKRAVDEMPCPVIANGNIVDVSTGEGMLKRTGAAGLMIGRGAIRNPWIFDQLRASFSQQKAKTITRADLYTYIMELYEEVAIYAANFDKVKHVQRMKKYLIYIAEGVDSEFEKLIRRVKTPDDFMQLCHDYLQNFSALPERPPSTSKVFCGFDDLR
ncbi:MAG: tRNA dihydrouridine synthase [Akkermansiaceae bacterium]